MIKKWPFFNVIAGLLRVLWIIIKVYPRVERGGWDSLVHMGPDWRVFWWPTTGQKPKIVSFLMTNNQAKNKKLCIFCFASSCLRIRKDPRKEHIGIILTWAIWWTLCQSEVRAKRGSNRDDDLARNARKQHAPKGHWCPHSLIPHESLPWLVTAIHTSPLRLFCQKSSFSTKSHDNRPISNNHYNPHIQKHKSQYIITSKNNNSII